MLPYLWCHNVASRYLSLHYYYFLLVEDWRKSSERGFMYVRTVPILFQLDLLPHSINICKYKIINHTLFRVRKTTCKIKIQALASLFIEQVGFYSPRNAHDSKLTKISVENQMTYMFALHFSIFSEYIMPFISISNLHINHFNGKRQCLRHDNG